MFTLTINTGNAAFDDGNSDAEVTRILRDCADRIEQGNGDWHLDGFVIQLRDSNGNVVGQAESLEA